jgi:hypothetical protein
VPQWNKRGASEGHEETLPSLVASGTEMEFRPTLNCIYVTKSHSKSNKTLYARLPLKQV